MLEQLKNLKEEVLQIAVEAGKEILEVYSNSELFEVESKDDRSPLTIADKRSNRVICDALEKMEIKYPIISEENKQIAYAKRKDYDLFWLVDPLDGTKEFIKRNGEFTVNIALVERNEVIMGVVYVPVYDELYWAIKGEGAFLVKAKNTTKLTVNSFKLSDPKLRVVCSRSHLNDETKAFIDNLQNPELVSRGSSLKFLIIAKAEADIYPRIGPTMEWDTAAAQIILEQAGGKVFKFYEKTPLQYNKENLLNPYFVAAGNFLET